MTGTRRIGRAALGAAWALIPCLALAQEAPAPAAGGPGQGACHVDVQRFCADAKGRPGGVAACLREHESELSEACRAQRAQRRGQARSAHARVRGACADEIARLCPDAVPGERGLGRCLRGHLDALSAGCRDALPEPGAGRSQR